MIEVVLLFFALAGMIVRNSAAPAFRCQDRFNYPIRSLGYPGLYHEKKAIYNIRISGQNVVDFPNPEGQARQKGDER